jgi:hypothetical protein
MNLFKRRVQSAECGVAAIFPSTLDTRHSTLVTRHFLSPPSDPDSPTTMGAEQADSSTAAGTALRPSFSNPPPPRPLPLPRLTFFAGGEAEAEAEEEKDPGFAESDLDSPTTMGAEQADSSTAAGTALRPSYFAPPPPLPLPPARFGSLALGEAEEEAEDEKDLSFCTLHFAFCIEDFPPSDPDSPTTMGAELADSSTAAGTALRPSFSRRDECRVTSDAGFATEVAPRHSSLAVVLNAA